MELVISPLLLCLVALPSVCGQNSLSEADKQEVLEAHNRFRRMVDPPATNMRKMQWNEELAMVAQNYANKCIFAHNSQRADQGPSFVTVGENLFVTQSQDVNYTAFVQAWHNEVKKYDYVSNMCSTVCGHYKQVVWADSHMVGCGVARCPVIVGFSKPNTNSAPCILLVCNYGPASNRTNQPYQNGSACLSCPTGWSVCEDRLCSFDDATPQTASSQPTPTAGKKEQLEPLTLNSTRVVPTGPGSTEGMNTSELPCSSGKPEQDSTRAGGTRARNHARTQHHFRTRNHPRTQTRTRTRARTRTQTRTRTRTQTRTQTRTRTRTQTRTQTRTRTRARNHPRTRNHPRPKELGGKGASATNCSFSNTTREPTRRDRAGSKRDRKRNK